MDTTYKRSSPKNIYFCSKISSGKISIKDSDFKIKIKIALNKPIKNKFYTKNYYNHLLIFKITITIIIQLITSFNHKWRSLVRQYAAWGHVV